MEKVRKKQNQIDQTWTNCKLANLSGQKHGSRISPCPKAKGSPDGCQGPKQLQALISPDISLFTAFLCILRLLHFIKLSMKGIGFELCKSNLPSQKFLNKLSPPSTSLTTVDAPPHLKRPDLSNISTDPVTPFRRRP